MGIKTLLIIQTMIHLRGIMIATYHDRKNISTIIPFKIQIRACRRRSAQLESAAVSDWRIAALGLSSSRPSFQLQRRGLGREAGSDRRKRTRGPSPRSLRLLRARGRGTQSSAPRHPLRSLLRSRQRRPLATAKTAESSDGSTFSFIIKYYLVRLWEYC